MAAPRGRQALLLDGPRSSILALFHRQDRQASSVSLAEVQEALAAGERARNPSVPDPEPFDNLPVAIGPNVRNLGLTANGPLTRAVRRACDGLQAHFASSRASTGDRFDGVVSLFAHHSLLCIANAINGSAELLPPLADADFRAPGVTNPGRGNVGLQIGFDYEMRDPVRIEGRADAVLLHRTQVAADPKQLRPPAVTPGNYYVPLCFLEGSQDGDDLLDDGLAACLIAAAVNGHRYNLASVVGIVTNLRQWRFVRVEAGPEGRVRFSDVHELVFNAVGAPERSANYAAGSLDHIVAAIILLCVGQPLA